MRALISVAGASRSGTTLIETFLARELGATSLGETRWHCFRGILKNERCQCGSWFEDCEFWSRLSGSSVTCNAKAINQLKDKTKFPAQFPLLYREYLRDLFSSMYRTGSVFIESSKHPLYCFKLVNFLESDMSVETVFLGVYRDPRGVVHSHQKQRRRSESRTLEYMNTRGFFSAIAYWYVANSALLFLLLFCKRAKIISYDKFCDDEVYRSKITRSFSHLVARNHSLHSISGNPSRLDAKFGLSITKDASFQKKGLVFSGVILMLCAPMLTLLSITHWAQVKRGF